MNLLWMTRRKIQRGMLKGFVEPDSVQLSLAVKKLPIPFCVPRGRPKNVLKTVPATFFLHLFPSATFFLPFFLQCKLGEPDCGAATCSPEFAWSRAKVATKKTGERALVIKP